MSKTIKGIENMQLGTVEVSDASFNDANAFIALELYNELKAERDRLRELCQEMRPFLVYARDQEAANAGNSLAAVKIYAEISKLLSKADKTLEEK